MSDVKQQVRPEQDIFDELAALCASPGFIHAIAMFCFRDNVIRYSDKLTVENYSKLHSPNRLIRTEISTLIGLMARGSIDGTLPLPSELEVLLGRAESLLEELHDALGEPMKLGIQAVIKRFKTEKSGETASPDIDAFETAAGLREPIFYGGDSAYGFQYRDFASLKYKSDNDWLKATKGFSIDEAVKVVSGAGLALDEKLNTWARGLKDISPDKWTMVPGFTLSSADVATHSKLPQDTIRQVLDAFCFANDGNPDFTSLSDFNATNAFPILKFADDEYIVLQYVSLTEALYDTPFYWMVTDKKYKATAMANRGRFAEDCSAERLEKVFGKGRVFRNVSIWKSKDERIGEIDTLVLFADRAVILQAKSKKLTIAARKGNDLQLRGDFRDAIQAACDQAFVCGEQVILNKCRFADANGNEIQLPKRVKRIHPICVVSDHYPALSFQARQFLRFAPSAIIVAPLVCDVFALDAITEFLETPLRLLSYLELRALAGNNVVSSHEITILGFHLKLNLWLGEYDMIHLHDDIATDVDIAMTARREGLNGEKDPPGILSYLQKVSLGRIVDELEQQSEPWPAEVGLELLKLGGNAVRDLSLSIDQIATRAAVDGRSRDVTFALGTASSGITIHCNDDDTLATAMRLKRHCELRKYSQKATTWYGLGLSPGDAKVRLTIVLEGPWEHDDTLEAAVRGMPKAQKPSAIRRLLRPMHPSKS